MGNESFFTVDGVRVTRTEDLRLITGCGRFAADWNLPGQLYGCFLRSDRAHARIVALDVAAARRFPGVHTVITGDDAVRAGYVQPVSFFTFAGKDGQRAKIPRRPVLAHGRVRFVGEPVALVVADSEDIARDACALIALQYEDLPCVIDPASAFAPCAAQLHEGIPFNQAFECEAGDDVTYFIAEFDVVAAHFVSPVSYGYLQLLHQLHRPLHRQYL